MPEMMRNGKPIGTGWFYQSVLEDLDALSNAWFPPTSVVDAETMRYMQMGDDERATVKREWPNQVLEIRNKKEEAGRYFRRQRMLDASGRQWEAAKYRRTLAEEQKERDLEQHERRLQWGKEYKQSLTVQRLLGAGRRTTAYL